jgi:hypothetical protein
LYAGGRKNHQRNGTLAYITNRQRAARDNPVTAGGKNGWMSCSVQIMTEIAKPCGVTAIMLSCVVRGPWSPCRMLSIASEQAPGEALTW